MFKQRIIPYFFITALFSLAITGCSSNSSSFDGSFEDGHEWIMPNPPAEFNLSILDADENPIHDANVSIYLDDTKLEQNQDFIDYDGKIGYPTDENGTVTIIYLGDQGGGYEVPIGASGPAELFLAIEAAGFDLQKISVVDYLFNNQYITGNKSFEFDDITFELKIIEDTITLNQ